VLTSSLIYIVDDDPLTTEHLSTLVTSIGYESAVYHSSKGFLSEYTALAIQDRPQCLLLNIHLPEMTGLALQTCLAEPKYPHKIPIIFITAHANAEVTLQAMKQGAVDVLSKPISPQALLDTLTHTLQQDVKYRKKARQRQPLLNRVEKLTPREYEVMGLIVKGHLNKQIAHILSISLSTVEFHRRKVMRKMQVTHVTHLLRLVLLNDLLPKESDE